MAVSFRPWGMLPWILNGSPRCQWSLIGALSTEKRCLAAWSTLKERHELAKTLLLKIKDIDSQFTNLAEEKLARRQDEFIAAGGSTGELRNYELFVNHAELVNEIDDFITRCGPDIVVDITSLPKRFFFPFVRRLVESSSVENLIATYTIPESYTQSPLAEGFQEWRPLPLFFPAEDKQCEVFIISVGFLSMGLPEQVRQYCAKTPVELIFPFPPGPPAYHRSWEFVMDLERGVTPSPKLRHVDTRDTSLAFDCLKAMTGGGTRSTLLAPYGPKPHSLAMCLFATLSDSKVCYTQPSVYHPDYSSGVRLYKGAPEVYAYCIRLGGRSFYEL